MKLFNQIKRPNDFIFYLLFLPNEKLRKVVFVNDYRPNFIFVFHVTKIEKVALKSNF